MVCFMLYMVLTKDSIVVTPWYEFIADSQGYVYVHPKCTKCMCRALKYVSSHNITLCFYSFLKKVYIISIEHCTIAADPILICQWLIAPPEK